MLLYYITGRTQFSGNERDQRRALLERISAAAGNGVDFIQLREKDLSGRELESLASEAVEAVRARSHTTSLLLNSRVDVALAVGADGVHLRSSDISAADVQAISRSARAERDPIIALSCHTADEVKRAVESGANFVVLGPVFEKKNTAATGPELLPSVSRCRIPVLALGGVNLNNAALCLEKGAAGIAGIRLFQEGNIAETVAKLRSLTE